MTPMTLTNNNFTAEVLECSQLVLVDFWASWCGPCKMIAPAVAEIAEEYDGKVKVGKVNVDEEERLAIRFGISSIPTLLIFKGGEIVNKSIGVRPKADLISLLPV